MFITSSPVPSVLTEWSFCSTASKRVYRSLFCKSSALARSLDRGVDHTSQVTLLTSATVPLVFLRHIAAIHDSEASAPTRSNFLGKTELLCAPPIPHGRITRCPPGNLHPFRISSTAQHGRKTAPRPLSISRFGWAFGESTRRTSDGITSKPE